MEHNIINIPEENRVISPLAITPAFFSVHQVITYSNYRVYYFSTAHFPFFEESEVFICAVYDFYLSVLHRTHLCVDSRIF